MELIKTITKTVSDAVDYTVRKTWELTDVARLKLQHAKTAERINKAYTRIGRLVYHDYHDGTDHAEEIAALCITIDEGHAELTRIADSIDGIKLLSEIDAKRMPEIIENNTVCEELFDTDNIVF